MSYGTALTLRDRLLKKGFSANETSGGMNIWVTRNQAKKVSKIMYPYKIYPVIPVVDRKKKTLRQKLAGFYLSTQLVFNFHKISKGINYILKYGTKEQIRESGTSIFSYLEENMKDDDSLKPLKDLAKNMVDNADLIVKNRKNKLKKSKG